MVLSIAPAAFAAGTTGGTAQDYFPDRTPEYADTSVAKKTSTDLGKDSTFNDRREGYPHYRSQKDYHQHVGK